MKTTRIGLLTAELNNENMGCNALAYSAISIFEKIAKRLNIRFEYVLFGQSRWIPDLYPECAHLKITAVRPIATKRQILKTFLQRKPAAFFLYKKLFFSCDIFFEIAGGDSFSDIYGINRPRFYSLIHQAIRRAGKSLVFLPQTIGPFVTAEAKCIAHNSLTGAQHIFARDPISYQLAFDIVGNEKLTQTIDMAFFMDYEPREKSKDKPRIGINPSGLLWSGGYTGDNQFGLKDDYRDMLRTLIKSIDPEQYEIELIAHVLHGPGDQIEDDYKVCRLLRREFPYCKIAPFFYTPVEAKSHISGLDLLVGSRMHCCIAAYSSGVPIYPLAYSRKFRGLFRDELGYEYGAELVMDRVEVVLLQFQSVLGMLEEIQSDMVRRTAELNLYKQKFLAALGLIFPG